MRSYSLIAPAKINLYLEIIGDRPDGYHELAMVLQSIDLADLVSLRALGTEQIRVNCSHPLVPVDHTNLAYRAAELMKLQFPEAFNRFGGVEITIDKRIPVGAGLAGGSTNAAAVLVGLDLMWQLGLTKAELQDLGAKLGSDVPFCVAGGTSLATGRGEMLAPLPTIDGLYAVLVKYRSLSVSTVWAYQSYRQQYRDTYRPHEEMVGDRLHSVHSGPMVAAITARQYSHLGELLRNDLEKVVLPAYPAVNQLKETFTSLGNLGTMMSGSGPTVFALARSAAEAEEMARSLQTAIPNPDLEVWVTKFVPYGVQLAS
ncbi:MAG: 4-(cytidine 5'-diphospho)-2-C-methyl-D-erythritol kinase [Synechococcales bacterium]|nr:4-(cytidine 5'-diphospho)-2-C-methyl-D-erythritol kinase [Synechococcales bacterium]